LERRRRRLLVAAGAWTQEVDITTRKGCQHDTKQTKRTRLGMAAVFMDVTDRSGLDV
jgi:hypothetical protein